MRLTVLPVLLLTLISASGCTSRLAEAFTGVSEPVVQGQPANLDTTKYEKVVVLVQTPALTNYDESRHGLQASIEGAVNEVLLSKNYTLAERSDLNAVLKEMHLQQDAGLTENNAVSAGRMLNAQAIIVVTLNRLAVSERRTSSGEPAAPETRIGMAAKLIDIERGSAVWQASYSDTHYGATDDCLTPVSHGLVRGLPLAKGQQPPPVEAEAAVQQKKGR